MLSLTSNRSVVSLRTSEYNEVIGEHAVKESRDRREFSIMGDTRFQLEILDLFQSQPTGIL